VSSTGPDPTGWRPRRRELLAAAGLAAAAAGGLVLGAPTPAAGQGVRDIEAITGAVRLEQALAVGYAAIARRPALGLDLRKLVAHLAIQEHEHAAALLKLAEYVGVQPPVAPSVAEVERKLPAVAAATDQAAALTALDELERAEILGFSTYVQVLTDVKLIQLVAAVMCGDAQHLAVVRQAAGEDPIPAAFETGQRR
jgi:rubrerythrin